MYFKPSIVALVVTVFTANLALAQSAITLRDSVERAVLRNPEVLFKNQNFLAVTSEQEAAQGGWRPRVDLSLGVGPESTKTPGVPSNSYSHSVGTVQLRQILFDGNAINNDVRRLGHSRMAAYYDLISTSNQIALEAAGAHADVLRFRELVRLAQENYATHRDVSERMASRTNAGVGRRVDLEQAIGRLALAESNWLSEVSNLHDVTARYNRLVGEEPVVGLNPLPQLSGFLPARTDFLTNTIRNNPGFLSAVANIRAFRASVELRKSSYLPTVELRLSQEVERNRQGLRGNYRDRSIEVVMNYNLYNGGTDAARVKQFSAQLNAAYDLRDKQCRDIRQTSLIALNDVNRLETQLVLLAQHELSTAKAREAYRQQFDIGQRSLLELLDTENELYDARQALVNAEYNLQLAKARVLTANGTLLQALALRPLQTDAPPQPNGIADDDELLTCSMAIPEIVELNKKDLPKVSVTSLPAPTILPISIPPTANTCQQVGPAVTNWLAAWNNKDIQAYLAAYSNSFEPPLNMSRDKWVALRKQRLGKSDDFKVVIKDIKQTQCSNNQSEMTFVQEFSSKSFSDTVEKQLKLEFVENQWKIKQEIVNKGRVF